MNTVLDEFVGSFAARVGVARACRAFGTPARSYRYRQQRARRTAARAAAAASACENADSSGSDAHHDSSSDTVKDAANAAVSDAVDDAHSDAAGDEGNAAASSDAAGGAAAVVRRAHPAALSSDERFEILDVLCSERFVDLSPHQVFMTLLDERRYLCSVRSMYRLLEEHGLGGDRRRGAHQSPGRHPMPIVQASRPNEAWSWDIERHEAP